MTPVRGPGTAATHPGPRPVRSASAAPGPSVPCAASSLLRSVLDTPIHGPASHLLELARTRTSVHYETGDDDVPVLCVGTPAAIRLPASILAGELPVEPVLLTDGALLSGGRRWQVARWWTPPRPLGLSPPTRPSWPEGVRRIDALRPDELVGLGPGLTPTGDDVLAGALVAASATADPRLGGWRAATVAALARLRTTAVSRALLLHALTGWATPELADFVTAACGGDTDTHLDRLLAVGNTSGAALASGVLHVLGTDVRRAVA